MKGFQWLSQGSQSRAQEEKSVLPVSVVLVVIKSRMLFVEAFVLPSIRANNPAEIIIIDDDSMTNQHKRNLGAERATQKYLFVCDDDVVMPAGHLASLVSALESHPECCFAYTDYQAIVMDPETHPKRKNYYHKASEFNLEKLKFHNYIDTCSLVRRESFPGFDPSIKRLQDWDLWLTIALKGGKGIYVKGSGIVKYYLDEGITSVNSSIEMHKSVLLNKHGLSGLLSILFIDSGNRFNDKELVMKSFNVFNGNEFSLDFDVSAFQSVKSLRFDPVENKYSRVKVTKVLYQFHNSRIQEIVNPSLESNGVIDKEGFTLFNTLDPRYMLPSLQEDSVAVVKVQGYIYFYDKQSIEEMIGCDRNSKQFDATLFVDTGDGFNPQESLTQKFSISKDGDIHLEYDVRDFESIRSLRFDPVDNEYCLVRLQHVEYVFTDGNAVGCSVHEIESNGVAEDNGFVRFNTTDPVFYLPVYGRRGLEKIKISFFVSIIGGELS